MKIKNQDDNACQFVTYILKWFKMIDNLYQYQADYLPNYFVIHHINDQQSIEQVQYVHSN